MHFEGTGLRRDQQGTHFFLSQRTSEASSPRPLPLPPDPTPRAFTTNPSSCQSPEGRVRACSGAGQGSRLVLCWGRWLKHLET